MPKGTPFHVTLRLWPSLLDDLELVALVRPDAGGAQQRAQGPGGAALASDNLADITLGDFEFDHAIVELLDENFVGGVDQRFRDQLNQSARICGGSGHRNQFMLLACSVLTENSIAGGHACTNRNFRRRSPRWPVPALVSRTACSRAPTFARLSRPSTRLDRASVRRWQDWCGGCKSRPLPPGAHCA